MMPDFVLQQQQQVLEENMSNLTSASGEASVSSSNNRVENANTAYPEQYFASQDQSQPPAKKKRNLPGNPDPDAEVIALSPKTLMATNRFVCEICNKGFQRDQNLQLHRRGHNLPWKLKQRTSKEVRKKVYVCPEPTCVHHEPSRALGDLTGIKKHFCRKHGEKKWKCDKCSKRYAVQSDWKAHSKTCGTREYRCDCGTLFSRRDSFITHRAFCDALAEESARGISNITSNNNPILTSHQPAPSHQYFHHGPDLLHAFPLKKELHHHHHHHQQQNFNTLKTEMPSWLVCSPGPPPMNMMNLPSSSSSTIFSRLDHHDLHFSQTHDLLQQEGSNPNPGCLGPNLPPYPPAATVSSPHMSATALLQKAAQMGAKAAAGSSPPPAMIGPHHQAHVSSAADSGRGGINASRFALNLSSLEEMANNGFLGHSLISDNSNIPSAHEIMTSFSNSGFGGSPFEDAFGADDLNDSKKSDFMNMNFKIKPDNEAGGGNNDDGLTRDFLGLKPLSHNDFFTIAGFGNYMNNSSSSSHDHHHQNQRSWHG